MSWLKPLLEIFAALGQWLQQRQLFNAGKAQQRAQDLEEQHDVQKKQDAAADSAPKSRAELERLLRDPDRDF